MLLTVLQCLSEADRSLPAVAHMLPLLKAGIGVHHSGAQWVLHCREGNRGWRIGCCILGVYVYAALTS